MFQKNLLAGKRILITGGATGLGKSMGQRFLELGAVLYICGGTLGGPPFRPVLAKGGDQWCVALGRRAR